MKFTHAQQLEWIEDLSKNTSSTMERNMLNSILTSIYDSKSHITTTNNMVHITMSHDRYKAYMEKIVTPQQS